MLLLVPNPPDGRVRSAHTRTRRMTKHSVHDIVFHPPPLRSSCQSQVRVPRVTSYHNAQFEVHIRFILFLTVVSSEPPVGKLVTRQSKSKAWSRSRFGRGW